MSRIEKEENYAFKIKLECQPKCRISIFVLKMHGFFKERRGGAHNMSRLQNINVGCIREVSKSIFGIQHFFFFF